MLNGERLKKFVEQIPLSSRAEIWPIKVLEYWFSNFLLNLNFHAVRSDLLAFASIMNLSRTSKIFWCWSCIDYERKLEKFVGISCMFSGALKLPDLLSGYSLLVLKFLRALPCCFLSMGWWWCLLHKWSFDRQFLDVFYKSVAWDVSKRTN